MTGYLWRGTPGLAVLNDQIAAQSKCGTYAGWNEHARARETPCDGCKSAHAEYVRNWRLRTGRTRSSRRGRRP